MTYNKRQRLPRYAGFIGGPLAGRRKERRSDKFPKFWSDEDRRTGYKWQKMHWHDRFENYQQPTAGYRLMLVPHKVNPRITVAEYWHCSVFWREAEKNDRFLEAEDRVEEWDEVALTRERFPESFKQATQNYAPQQAAFWIDCIEMAEKEGHVMPDGRPTAEALAEDIGIELPLH